MSNFASVEQLTHLGNDVVGCWACWFIDQHNTFYVHNKLN